MVDPFKIPDDRVILEYVSGRIIFSKPLVEIGSCVDCILVFFRNLKFYPPFTVEISKRYA